MSRSFTSTFETLQTLRREAFELDHRLFLAYMAQSRITLEAAKSKTRWEREMENLRRIIRIWRKSNARCDRRQAAAFRFYL